MNRTITGHPIPLGLWGQAHPLAIGPASSLSEALVRRLAAHPGWVRTLDRRTFRGFGPANQTIRLPYVSYYIVREGAKIYGFEDEDKNQLIYYQFSIYADSPDEADEIAGFTMDCFDPDRPEEPANWPMLRWRNGTCIDATYIGGPTIETKDRNNNQATVAQKVAEWCFEVCGRR